jgi:hypothetical protein
MKTLFNPLFENAYVPIRDHCNAFSNVIDSSDLQSEKQKSLMISTLAGMKRIFNPLLENACASIRCNFDSFSNVIDSSDSQLEKH